MDAVTNSYAGFFLVTKIGEFLLEEIKDLADGIIYILKPVLAYLMISHPCIFILLMSLISFSIYFLLRAKCTSIYTDLRTQLEKSWKIRHEVERLVDDTKRNGEIVLPRVQKWLTSMNENIEDQMNLLDNGVGLDLIFYYLRNKLVQDKTAVVGQLIQKGSSFDRVSTFESRISDFDKIMEALRDDGINRIGIYGEGGVGKTRLVKQIGEEAKDGNLFEEVVMVTVSSHSTERIQCEIADMLGLKFDDGNVGRARRLHERLEEKQRILVILDDIQEKVELEATGIPFRERYKGCKIVLVSQSQEACEQSGTEKDFLIQALSEDEGWKLFRRMAGVPIDSQDHDLRARVETCAGLPRAILQAAREWRRRS